MDPWSGRWACGDVVHAAFVFVLAAIAARHERLCRAPRHVRPRTLGCTRPYTRTRDGA